MSCCALVLLTLLHVSANGGPVPLGESYPRPVLPDVVALLFDPILFRLVEVPVVDVLPHE